MTCTVIINNKIDAERAYKAGAFESAKKWTLKSLSYSVGVFHPDYIAAKGDSK